MSKVREMINLWVEWRSLQTKSKLSGTGYELVTEARKKYVYARSNLSEIEWTIILSKLNPLIKK